MSNLFGPGHHPGTAETNSRPAKTATGKPFDAWFAQCNVDGSGGTSVDEQWLNLLVDNLRVLTRSAGANESDETAGDMLAEAAARYMSGASYAVDGGLANAYVVTNPLGFKSPKALFTGMRVRFKPINANTGASTLVAYTLPIKALRRPDDTALAAGELPAGIWAEAIYDAAANSAAGAWLLAPESFSGQVMPRTSSVLFVQAAAPLGWTKSTAIDDHMLRLVSGTGGAVHGSVAASVLFARTATDGYTLLTADEPAHRHFQFTDEAPVDPPALTGSNQAPRAASITASTTFNYGIGGTATEPTIGRSQSVGGGGAHAHGFDNRLKYADGIVCTRN